MAILLRDKMVHGIEPSGINGNKRNPDKTKQKIAFRSCGKKGYLNILWRLICFIEAENNWEMNECCKNFLKHLALGEIRITS